MLSLCHYRRTRPKVDRKEQKNQNRSGGAFSEHPNPYGSPGTHHQTGINGTTGGPQKSASADQGTANGTSGGQQHASVPLSVCDRLHDSDWTALVECPANVDAHEWIATHTLSFFNHVSLLYGSLSYQFCTTDTCPTMTGPGNVQYPWVDDRGKKVKCSAPQYADYVLTYVEAMVRSEDTFPTKYGNQFAPQFRTTMKRVTHLLWHIIAHFSSNHARHFAHLGLGAQLTALTRHFAAFASAFNLLSDSPKELKAVNEVLAQLARSRPPSYHAVRRQSDVGIAGATPDADAQPGCSTDNTSFNTQQQSATSQHHDSNNIPGASAESEPPLNLAIAPRALPHPTQSWTPNLSCLSGEGSDISDRPFSSGGISHHDLNPMDSSLVPTHPRPADFTRGDPRADYTRGDVPLRDSRHHNRALSSSVLSHDRPSVSATQMRKRKSFENTNTFSANNISNTGVENTDVPMDEGSRRGASQGPRPNRAGKSHLVFPFNSNIKATPMDGCDAEKANRQQPYHHYQQQQQQPQQTSINFNTDTHQHRSTGSGQAFVGQDPSQRPPPPFGSKHSASSNSLTAYPGDNRENLSPWGVAQGNAGPSSREHRYTKSNNATSGMHRFHSNKALGLKEDPFATDSQGGYNGTEFR